VQQMAVLAQFETDREGMLRPVPASAPIDPSRGVRFRDGVLQLGLDNREIEHLYERLERLLRDVRERDIPLF